MRFIIFAFFASIFILPAAAESIALSDLDEETRVYIQRGNHGHNVDCYLYVLDMIGANEAGFDKSKYYVTFDDPDIDGIAVGAADSGEFYTCENGELHSWDAGDSEFIKRF